MGVGGCIAAEKIGRMVNKDIWCVSIDGNEVTLELMWKGVAAVTLGYPRRMCAIVIEQMAEALDGDEVPYFLEIPSTDVGVHNIAEYCSGVTWTEPIAWMPEFVNGLPSGQLNQ